MRVLFALIFCALTLVTAGDLRAEDLKLAVTTSFHNSGLADVLLPEIRKDLGLTVHLLVVGTGQALKLGRAGDVDAVLVHSRAAEDAFVAEGYGAHRRDIMYNDFVFVGPDQDPAKIRELSSAKSALTAIAETGSIFVSRGDDSGTHRKERSLWKMAGKHPETFDAAWYRATGSGMGATLNTASALNGYVFTDRASWLNFKNKGEMVLLFAGDPALFNQYGYLPVNPERHPHVKYDLARKLENWLTGEKGQKLIGTYEIDGQTLFTPNAKSK